jgi:hypothetical protein
VKRRLALLLAASFVLAGCAHLDSGLTPPQDQVSEASALDSQRDIVVAVENPLAPAPTRAGSNLLGYASARSYGAGRQALFTLDALKRRYSLREVAAWPIKPLGVYCAVLQPPPGVSRDELIASLAADERVQLVQPLQDFSVYSSKEPTAIRTVQAPPYNDPYIDLQRGFIATDAAAAQVHAQGQGVEVAIVDTGADTAHPDLRGRIRDVHDLVGGDAPAFNRDSHGTEVAGIIAANSNNRLGIAGMAPKTRLSIYKACWYPQPGASARCNSFTLAKALATIAGSDARIINLSLGGPSDPLLRRLLEQLLHQGRIVVAAMPPDGRLTGFPAEIPGVIVVRTSSSASTPPGVLNAPGDDILTTQPGNGYDFTSGSSMAAAHVSGMAALLLSLSPDLDARSTHELMRRTSKPSDGLVQVNADAAVGALTKAGKASRRLARP